MRPTVILLAAAALLAGCDGREQQAARACDKAVKDKLAGRSYELSLKTLAQGAKSAEGETLTLTAPIVFDKGLSSEYRQVLDCRVRFEAGKDPGVTFLQFNWATEDLKRD